MAVGDELLEELEGLPGSVR